MNIVLTSRFQNDAIQLSQNKQKILKNILLKISNAPNINSIESEPIVGFPYIHKIDFFEKYIVFYFSTHTNTI